MCIRVMANLDYMAKIDTLATLLQSHENKLFVTKFLRGKYIFIWILFCLWTLIKWYKNRFRISKRQISCQISKNDWLEFSRYFVKPWTDIFEINKSVTQEIVFYALWAWVKKGLRKLKSLGDRDCVNKQNWTIFKTFD